MSSLNWPRSQPALAASHRTYALDLPGHGESGKDAGRGDLGVLSESVADFCDALDIPKAHFVGHSLGGSRGMVDDVRRCGVWGTGCIDLLQLYAFDAMTPPRRGANAR